MRRPLVLLGAALVALAPFGRAPAQQATMTWQVRGELPDTLGGMASGAPSLDMLVTAAADGPLTGFQVTFGPDMLAGGALPFDLSTMRLQAVMNTATDSIAVGVVLPPEMAAMAGGALGYRLDFAIPSPSDLRAMIPDSLWNSLEAEDTEDQARFENTGATSEVAGVRCEEWRVVAVDGTGAVRMCLAEAPPAMRTITDASKRILPEGDNPFSKILDRGRARFGGRDLVALRMSVEGPTGMTFELVSMSERSPGPGFFELPIDLEPFPIEAIQGLMQVAQQSQS